MNFGKETETFEERHRYFFQNCSYRFEGLDQTTRLGFESIIQRLSGTIDRHSKYSLTEKSYFEREENKNRDDLYSIIYIEDCLDACDILGIEPYRFLTNKNVQDCQCSIAKHILRADSCERYYYNNICCLSCDDVRSMSDSFNNNLIIPATDIPNIYQARKIKDEDLLNLLSKKKKKFPRTDNQTHHYSSSEYDSYDEAFDTCYSSSDSELNESRDKSVPNENQGAEKDAAKCMQNNVTVDANSKMSSRKESEKSVPNKNQGAEKEAAKCMENNVTVDANSKISSRKESEKSVPNKNQRAEKEAAKCIENNSSVDVDRENLSSDESISNANKESDKNIISNNAQDTMNSSEDSSSNEFISNIRKWQKKNKTKRNIITVDLDSDEFVVKKRKTFQEPISSCKNSCIILESDDSSDDDPAFNEELEAQQRPSCSRNNNVVIGTSNPSKGQTQLNKGLNKSQSARSSENKDVQHTYKWWLHLPERDENPYFEERHRSDDDRRRGQTFTLDEQRQMIAYLVKTNKIANAKSRVPWKHMLIDGYMRHRSVESLSNNFRKIILPKIDEFGLPLEIRLQFHHL